MGARILVLGGPAAERDAVEERLRRAGHIVVTSEENSTDLAISLDGDAIASSLRTVALLSEGPDFPERLAAALARGVNAVLPRSVDDARLAREIEVAETLAHAVSVRKCVQLLAEIEQLLGIDAPVREVLAKATPCFGDATLLVFDGDPPIVVDDRGDLGEPRTLAEVPEARTAMATDEVVVAPAAAAFPIDFHGRTVGALVFRRQPMALDEVQLRMGRVLAGLLAPLCERPHLLEGSASDLTGRIIVHRPHEERRLRAIEKFRAYFEAAADSVVVLDGAGRILFVNRAAEGLTGFARDGLIGKPIADIVPAEWRARLAPLVAGVVGGRNLEGFDLPLVTTSGDTLWVSVATLTVLAEHQAAILSFRDVTSERRLEAELRKTKDFLQRLIDSTVDAILAADVDGTLILYNPGAERIFGWPAGDVIGRMNIERLYPDGVARQIMRMLRSTSYGGVGRLELTRREVVTRVGDIVPVNMTASIIYEDGREVATVGILSDLRERIRIEQRLLMAQEKLLITEKQAVIAELAGAAAHELNQPLTSVTLYIEMMMRRMPPDDVNQRAVHAIARESNRMAEIVKKIGRITRYETKQYVGGANILDLEKSSDAAAPGDDSE